MVPLAPLVMPPPITQTTGLPVTAGSSAPFEFQVQATCAEQLAPPQAACVRQPDQERPPCDSCTGACACPLPSPGDRVEVEYERQWYTGALDFIDPLTGLGHVKCDVDQEGVLTVAPLWALKRLTNEAKRSSLCASHLGPTRRGSLYDHRR